MSAPSIDDYRFGRIVVDEQSYGEDLIILPDRIIAHWWRQKGHTLLPEDLKEVLAAGPDLLVVGQGAYSRMTVAPEARLALEQAGIELIAQATGQACETYNRLRGQQAIAAALHLTC